MVRLKVELSAEEQRIIDISIPYGAIKRISVFITAYYLHISIPYGAIKSCFKKVNRMYEDCISIPYGAIKS